ncbi:hypothetical protein ACYCW3_000235 [Klebsiella quasipneumoniae]
MNITELAHRLKEAAEKSIAEEGLAWFSEDLLSDDGGIALHAGDAKFIALASHENAIDLVEAPEKAQQMEAYWKTL